MAATSSIEWTDATWQPITGCAVVSPGCTNCYAMRLAGTRQRHHWSRIGLTRDTKAGPVWTGESRFNEEWLLQPLRWRRPRRIFVCAHGDLFAESVPDPWIDQVFAVMALADRHTMQVLTKRSGRARAYLTDPATTARIAMAMARITAKRSIAEMARGREIVGRMTTGENWPLRKMWLGVSVEDQRRADERVPDLLATPAAVRFVSGEPLLGPINFAAYLHDSTCLLSEEDVCTCSEPREVHLDWIIVGGESGAGARPMHPDWARAIRDQCDVAGVPFFFKQWGEFAPEGLASEAWHVAPGAAPVPDPLPNGIGRHAKAGHWRTYRVGKKAAGRLLDGRAHDAMPEAAL